jgi:hypothetical protein
MCISYIFAITNNKKEKIMNTINDIKNRIINTLSNVGKTEYFSVYTTTGEEVKIRVGNHSGNRLNNGETKTLSFITNRTEQSKSGYNAMIEEWVVDMETGLTDTFQTIEQVLDWEDVSDNQEAAEELNYELI